MRTMQTSITLLILVAVVACASIQPRERLAQAEAAYTAAVETAIELRRAGVIDEETARELTPAFTEANDLLQRAHNAIVDGDYGLAEDQIDAVQALVTVILRRMRQDE